MEIYNLLGNAYFPKQYFRYSTHLDSELRYIYESIVDRSSREPLYHVKPTTQNRDFAIALKESSFAFQMETEAAFLEGETEVFGEEVKSLVGHFNDLLQHTADYSEVNPYSAVLFKSFGNQIRRHKSELEEAGLHQKEGSILFDLDTDFSNIKLQLEKKGFLFEVFEKVKGIAADPMKYTKKYLVTYANYSPKVKNCNPYMTSIYSGMLFNYFC